MTALIVREGASTYNADELGMVYVDDALSLLPDNLLVTQMLKVDLESVKKGDIREDLSSEWINSLVQEAEDLLWDAGYVTDWNDGYTITPKDTLAEESAYELDRDPTHKYFWETDHEPPA